MSGKTSLYARLLGIESEFLFAISGDDASLESFRVIWVALQQDIQSAQIAGTLKQDVVELAFSVSTRIRIISEAFQELEETVQQLSNELDQELDRLYEGSLSSQGDSSSDDNIGISRIAPYIQGAYTWLLDNLHNPYPPKDFKDQLARKSGSSTKLIDGWFVDVRKRMGWAKIKKDFFQNKRKPLVEAATCLLVNGGMVSDVLSEELAQMVATAKKLYDHKVCLDDISKQTRERSSHKSEVSKNHFVSSLPRSCLEQSMLPESMILDRCDSNGRKRPRLEQDSIDQRTNRSNKRNRFNASDFASASEDGILSSTSSTLITDQSMVPSKQAYDQSLRREDSASITYSSSKHTSGSCRETGLQDASDAITLPVVAPKVGATSSCSVGSTTLLQSSSTTALKPLFPFELPRSTNYDQSTVSLSSLGVFEGCQRHNHPSVSNDDDFIVSSEQPDSFTQALCADPGLFPTLVDGLFGDNQSLDLLQSYALESIPPPATDISDADFDLSSFFGYDTSSITTRLPKPLPGNPLFSDFLFEADVDSSGPSLPDTKAAKMAQLAQLKTFNSHIQERIKLLECQIAFST